MDKHHGQIVEAVVRKNGYNLTTLANEMGVNRRSIYNWFLSSHLKRSVIFQIGIIIRHDFSKEFPELFQSSDFKDMYNGKSVISYQSILQNSNSDHWKSKYIELLENYNTLLLSTTLPRARHEK